MRAPGMSINRMPLMIWSTLDDLVVGRCSRCPALTAALVFLYFDRRFGMHFFDAAQRRQPAALAALFWVFGHPWVYIVVLPATGMVSMIIPTFCRRPLVGYTLRRAGDGDARG